MTQAWPVFSDNFQRCAAQLRCLSASFVFNSHVFQRTDSKRSSSGQKANPNRIYVFLFTTQLSRVARVLLELLNFAPRACNSARADNHGICIDNSSSTCSACLLGQFGADLAGGCSQDGTFSSVVKDTIRQSMRAFFKIPTSAVWNSSLKVCSAHRRKHSHSCKRSALLTAVVLTGPIDTSFSRRSRRRRRKLLPVGFIVFVCHLLRLYARSIFLMIRSAALQQFGTVSATPAIPTNLPEVPAISSSSQSGSSGLIGSTSISSSQRNSAREASDDFATSSRSPMFLIPPRYRR